MLSSFPQDPFADSARGSLTAKDKIYLVELHCILNLKSEF